MEKKPFYHSPEAIDHKTKESLQKVLKNKNPQVIKSRAEGALGVFSVDEIAEKTSKEAKDWLIREGGVKLTKTIRDKDSFIAAKQAMENIAGDQKLSKSIRPDDVRELSWDDMADFIIKKKESNSQKPPKQRFGRN